MAPTLVVLAAGVGSRYGGLKQLESVGPSGEALVEYSIYDAHRAGFSRVVIVVRPETESSFRDAFAGGLAKRVPIVYVHQKIEDLPRGFTLPPGRIKPWGTGQAVLAAESVVQGAFAVINADDFYGAESFVALARFLGEPGSENRSNFAMVGFELGQTLSESGSVSRAICQLDPAGHLQGIVEVLEVWKRGTGGVYTDGDGRQVALSGREVVSMNMWGFTQELFPELEARFEEFLDCQGELQDSEFLVPEVIQALIREGRVQIDVLGRAGKWCGITYPEDRERVSGMIRSLVETGEYPARLWE